MIKNVFKISSLFFLSIASFLFYYLEVIVHGWEGLKWTSNFYWSLLVVPFILLNLIYNLKFSALLLF
ncbi:MAG: hypothetical protein MJ179_11580, partial [Treponema sp.]|nr:hypothetical protein [Treponema sp.]